MNRTAQLRSRPYRVAVLSLWTLVAVTFPHPARCQDAPPPAVSAEVHVGKGYDALKQENYDLAASEFRAALSLDSTLVLRARFPLAVALFEKPAVAHANAQGTEIIRAD